MIRFHFPQKSYFLFSVLGLWVGCAVLDPPENVKARAELSNLVITEIHYNPLSEDTVSGDEFEFIELYNRGDEEISLMQVGISDGIDYTFDNSATIKSGEYLVLASNKSMFTSRYKFEPFDEFNGNLKNSGERIALSDLDAQREFLVIEYSDQSPWPLVADGEGNSLVPVSSGAQGDLTNSNGWRASFRLNGSPGDCRPGACLC